MSAPDHAGLRRWTGALFHVAAAPLVYLLWRFTGLSGGMDAGLLLPLAWLLAGLLLGRGGVPLLSAPLLALHVVLAAMWTSGGPMPVIARAAAVGALLPGLARIAGNPARRFGPALALVPLLPLAVLTVTVSGDEPFNAAIAEQIASPGGDLFADFAHQRGDPTPGVMHHQPLFPFLLVPGYPLGMTGMRAVSALMALATAALLGASFRRAGLPGWRTVVFVGLLTMPFVGVLGTLYPIWAALPIFLAAMMHGMRTRNLLWPILATILLTLVKVRFAAFGIGLMVAATLESGRRRRLFILAGCVAVPALFLAVDGLLLGGRVFWVRYGNDVAMRSVWSALAMRPVEVLSALPYALLDVEAGLLWKSPWVLLALAGIPALRREHRQLYRWLGIPAAMYLFSLFVWVPTDWHGAPTPVARMLLPAVPFLLASLSMTLRNRSAGLLLALSLAVSCMMIASPGLRFNDMDGTDALVTLLLGPGTPADSLFPSIVRPVPAAFVLFGAVAAILLWIIARNRGHAAIVLLPAALLAGAASRATQTSWEAEDMGSSMVSGCDVYPPNTDPFLRKFWFHDRQLFLVMEDPGDEVRIPVPPWDDDSVTVRVSYRTLLEAKLPRLEVECAGVRDTFCLLSPPTVPPTRFHYVTRTKKPEIEPGNMEELVGEASFANPGPGGTILLRPVQLPDSMAATRGGLPLENRIMLDRVEFLR